MKTTTSQLRNSINRSPLRRGFVLTPFLLAWFCLSPASRALSPPPDGGYRGGNTAEGDNVLSNLTTGLGNTGLGFQALLVNTTGTFNSATGARALLSNTTGNDNTATGAEALASNTTGNLNTADGAFALLRNTTGLNNTATGYRALLSNTTGDSNMANGLGALRDNTTGSGNTANGVEALLSNTTGGNNTATGFQALFSNTTGIRNAAYGLRALFSNTSGSFNVALAGGSNLTTGHFNIDIGNDGVAGESDTIRVGTQGRQEATFIAGISGSPITGVAVVVNSNGRLGVAASSQRFKDEIKSMDSASEAILALRPVTFRCKPEIDPDSVPQFGLVAEEVERINPALVTRDAEGKVFTVRYDAVNAMLLNEFLKEHRKVENQSRKIQEQDATITQLRKDFQSRLAEQHKQIEALTAGLQKVSAQIEASKAAPRVVTNNQ
jgi:hypothetical protein